MSVVLDTLVESICGDIDILMRQPAIPHHEKVQALTRVAEHLKAARERLDDEWTRLNIPKRKGG